VTLRIPRVAFFASFFSLTFGSVVLLSPSVRLQRLRPIGECKETKATLAPPASSAPTAVSAGASNLPKHTSNTELAAQTFSPSPESKLTSQPLGRPKAEPGPEPPKPESRVESPHPSGRPSGLNGAATLGPVYTVKAGESITSIARRYLSQTDFMTVSELESAIRQTNGAKAVNGARGMVFRPGTELAIPGFEAAPVVEHPVLVAKDFEIRAIYLTGYMAGSEHGISLIRRWREAGGNAIVFDVKDMDGWVNVPFVHAFAPKRRYVPISNPPKFTRFLHSLGLHAIARIALFRDEYQAQNHPQLAVRSRRSGQPWRENGKLVWTDPSLAEVQDYNLALARQVATSGVDEIQFDYVRFPAEGDQQDARFSFQSQHPEWARSDMISHFLSRAYSDLHPLGVLVSLDVFGVMAWQRPVDLAHTGQDIVTMARSCDVLSPMIYPSHFFHMDGYALPGDAPEHFIEESMQRFSQLTADRPVVLRPWLQAFGWRTRTYSAAYIQTQVRVARKNGGIGFLFWNAQNDYARPFLAMNAMRAQEGQFFRGDEISTAAAAVSSGVQ